MTIQKSYTKLNGFATKVPYIDVKCKYCGSRNVIKWGKYRQNQQFFCKDCKRKFADNDALPYMQTPIDQVGAAVAMYYEGQSLNSIRRLIQQLYNSYPSDSTIYRWVTRFTKKAQEESESIKLPDLGDVWVADETMIKLDGRYAYFWDIIDAKTRFLLASHLTYSRKMKEAQTLMEKAAKRAGKTPKVVITDYLASYIDGIERAFGADSTHIQSKPFTKIDSTNPIERFHGTLKDRTKVMRGLKNIRTARVILEGWLIHYNFLRPHESLEKTPAEAAGVRFPYRNWQDIVAKKPMITVSQTSATSATPVIEYKKPVFEQPTYTKSGYRIAKKKRKKQTKQRQESPPVLMGMRL